MISAMDWSAVAELHHDDGTGRCACGVVECRKRAMAEQQSRTGWLVPLRREFRSVFWHGEVER